MEFIDLNKLQKQGLNIKLMLYGEAMLGKTTFALTFPNPLVISTDGNLNGLTKNPTAKGFVVKDEMENNGKKVNGWLVFKYVVDQALASEDFKTVVVDNIKDIYDMCRKYVLDTNGLVHESESKVRGKIWTLIENEFLPVVRKLMTANKNIIFIAHEKKDEDGFIAPNTIDSVRLKITAYVDIVARMIKSGVPGQEKTAITIGNALGQISGNRMGLKGTITEPTYEKLEQIIKDGK